MRVRARIEVLSRRVCLAQLAGVGLLCLLICGLGVGADGYGDQDPASILQVQEAGLEPDEAFSEALADSGLEQIGKPRPRRRGLISLRRPVKRFIGRLRNLNISGRNDLTFRASSVSGTEAAYRSAYWNTGTTTNVSSMRVEGPLPVPGNEFGIQADWTSLGYGPSRSRWQLIYAGHDTTVRYGDLNVNLAGNEFARFSKSLHGIELDTDIGADYRLQAFGSREEGIVRRETFVGNNTPGPYFLRFTPVLDGSEVVKVNEELMHLGKDYRLDFETGQLYFEPFEGQPRIIPSDATISVSYQSLAAGGSPGTLFGGRLSGPLFKRGEIGLTMLRQDRAGHASVDTADFAEDRFIANNSTGPFELRGRPVLEDGARVIIDGKEQIIQQALVVLVDGIQQVEGVDFDIRRDLGVIEFRRIVPATSWVQVKYYYGVAPGTTAGDTTVIGMDLGLRVTRDLNLNAAVAQSTSEAGSSGLALRLAGGYQTKKLNTQVEYRSIEPNFSYIDTVGFQRNERGLNARLGYRPLDWIDFYTDWSRLKSSQGLAFGFSGYGGGRNFGVGFTQPTVNTSPLTSLQLRRTAERTTLDNEVGRTAFGVNIHRPNWPRLSLSRNALRNSGTSRADSNFVTDQVSLNWAPEKSRLSADLSFTSSHQDVGEFGAGTDVGTPTGATGSRSQMLRAAFGYQPGSKLHLTGNFSTNRSRARGVEEASTGRTLQFSASYNPWDNLGINLDQTLSSSCGAVQSGYYGGIGGAVGGISSPSFGSSPGFSTFGHATGGPAAYTCDLPGGIPNPSGTTGDSTLPTASASRNRYTDAQTRMSISYRPWERFGLNLNLSRRKYTSGGNIGYLADSNQYRGDISFDWQPTDALSLNSSFSLDRTDFLEAGRGEITNNWISLGGSYHRPDSPWSFSLNLSRQKGTSPSFSTSDQQEAKMVDTSLLDVSGTVTYHLNKRVGLSLGLAHSDFRGGDFADFRRENAELALEYRISDIMALRAGYQFLQNTSRLPASTEVNVPGVSRQNANFTANIFTISLTTAFATGQRTRAATPGSGFDFGPPRRGSSRFYNEQSFGYGGIGSPFGGFGGSSQRYRSGPPTPFGSPGISVPGGMRNNFGF